MASNRTLNTLIHSDQHARAVYIMTISTTNLGRNQVNDINIQLIGTSCKPGTNVTLANST